MKSRAFIIGTILSLIIAIMIPEVVAAKKPVTDEDPAAAGALYGDLFVLERDGAGVPLTRRLTYEDGEHGIVNVDCVQPLRFDCALLPFWGECGVDPLPDGVLPLPGAEEGEIPCTFNPETHDACEVYDDERYPYASELQEVSFGRGSVTRSKAFVIDSAYGEFFKVINDALYMYLDPAGRITMVLPSETDPDNSDANYLKTVDAPLENLGMYRATMMRGCFDIITEGTTGEEGATMIHTSALDPTAIFLLYEAGLEHLLCPYVFPIEWEWNWDYAKGEEAGCTVIDDPGDVAIPECWWEMTNLPADYTPGELADPADMLSATAFLAAATDKANPMSLDEFIYINTYIGINPYTYTRVRKETTLTVEYFPFIDPDGPASWFAYDRSATFPLDEKAALLMYDGTQFFQANAELLLFDDEANTAYQFSFVDLDVVNLQVCRQGEEISDICDGALAEDTDNAYDPDAETFGCGGANWFAQAVEHARKTVWYLHNWSVPDLAQ